ncbi:MAG: hypothetical protein ABL879_13730 [Devosia sp.]
MTSPRFTRRSWLSTEYTDGVLAIGASFYDLNLVVNERRIEEELLARAAKYATTGN